MPVSPARSAAFKILLRVETENSFASDLLNSAEHQNLSSQDHGLATELTMGVLRWQAILDQQISNASNLPLRKIDVEVLTSLRIAAYQLLFLDRVPASAAVNDSVEIVKKSRKRSAMPFTNAVLRKLAATLPPLKRDWNLKLTAVQSHPKWLVDRWIAAFGDKITAIICEYDQMIPQTTLHLSDDNVESELRGQGIELEPGKVLTRARRVKSGDVTNAASYRHHRASIQDEASQVVAMLTGRASTILDCCAAPGGKTRIIAERNPAATIVAVDLHPHRARRLRDLVQARNVQVIAGDILHLPTESRFESVLVDVPCSGTGTLARNPEIRWKLTMDDITDLQSRQLAILRSAMRFVSPGGRLVYSTCSLEREENSDVVESALSADNSFSVVNCASLLRQLRLEGELAVLEENLDSLVAGDYFRTFPGIYPADGFFAAVLRKEAT